MFLGGVSGQHVRRKGLQMNRISLMAAAVLTVVLAVAASAQAGPITVLNPGFEYFKSTTDNTDYNNMPDDWLPTRVGVSEPCGQITWDVHQTSGTKGMWANDMVPYHNGAYQVLGTDLLANTIYTLSVDVLGGPGQGMGLGYGDFPSGSVIGYQDLPSRDGFHAWGGYRLDHLDPVDGDVRHHRDKPGSAGPTTSR